MAYTLNPSSQYKIGTLIDTVSYQSDPTYSPYRTGEERVLSLSGSTVGLSTPTKKELQEYVQDFPIFHDQDEWKDALVQLDSGPMFSSPNERKTESVNEDKDEEQKATLVAYDPASERYILKTSEGHKMMSADELFSRLDKDLKVYADGLFDRFPSCELFWQDQGDVYMRGHQPGGTDDELSVERISVHDLKEKLAKVYENEGQAYYDSH